MPPNKLQKQAIEYLSGPLLVIAGPGTGKTQLLSKKVEYILEKTDANPENILCLTFTESGAQNMRERLFSMVGRAAAKVQIHTYHALGSDILAEYRNYATEFSRNLDSPVDEILQYKIIKEIQDGLDGNDILRGDKISDIIDTIASAKSARLSSSDLEKIAASNMATAEEMGPELSEILGRLSEQRSWRFPAAMEQVYGPILEVLAKYVDEEPIAPGIYKEANTYLLELNQIVEEEGAKEKPSVSPLSRWKDRRFEKDENGNYRLKNVVANKKLLSLAKIMEAYDERLRAEGLFDFADMIEEAIRILKEDKGFRLSLSERYQYILLDEFQDTNPSQAELIRLLTDYEEPTIMAVGDDDQAIFEFQGANASGFIDFQNHYNAKVITLKDNYRSTAEILKFSRCIADQLENSFAKTRGIDKNLVARKSVAGGSNWGTPKELAGPEGRSPLGTREARSADEDALGENSRQAPPSKIERHEFLSSDGEYFWVAEKIAELVKAGVSQKEIAIIAPKHKYIQPLLPYLKAHDGVYVAYEKRDNLFLDSKISEILTIAKFVFKVANDQPAAEMILPILSFPCFRISPLAAIKAARRDNKKSVMDYFAEAEDEKIRQVGEFLAALVQKSFEAPLELMLDYIVGTVEVLEGVKSPFLDYYTDSLEPGFSEFSLYENLNTLRAALNNYLKNVEGPKLAELISFLNDYEMAGAALVNTSPYSEADDAIQILTAHKSKGLEFSYVFLIAMDDMSWGKGKGNNNFLVLPANLIQIRHTGTTDDERLRLLFVAITRAKANLILTNSLTDFSGKTPKRLEYLGEHEEDGKLVSPFVGEIKTHYEDLDAAKKETDLRLSWVAAYKELTPELKPILLKRLENYHLTASDLTLFIDVCYAGPVEFYKRKVLLAPQEPMSGALVFGTLIHAVFEKVTREKISDEEAIEFFRNEAMRQPVLLEERKYMLELGAKALEKSLVKFGPILKAPGAAAEVDFYSEHLQYEEVPLTGKIDHININHGEKTIELYDFKTSKFHAEKWDSNDTLYKYKLQLLIYKMLLNLSPTYAKYKVSRAHILFVTPDGYDEVHDKVYEFNDKDEAELKALAWAVYRQIKTLDFVGDPEMFVEADEKKGLKDIKEFVKRLIDDSSK